MQSAEAPFQFNFGVPKENLRPVVAADTAHDTEQSVSPVTSVEVRPPAQVISRELYGSAAGTLGRD